MKYFQRRETGCGISERASLEERKDGYREMNALFGPGDRACDDGLWV